MIKDLFSIIRNNKVIVEGASLLFALRMIQMVLGFCTTYFLVRALTIEQYGYYSLIISILGALSIFSLPEMNNLTMQSVARGYYGTYRLALKKSFYFSFIGSLAAWIIAAYYTLFGNHEDLCYGLVIAGALFPFTYAMIMWKGLRLAEHEFRKMAGLDAMGSIIISLLIILASLYIPENYLIPLSIFLFVPALINIIITKIDLLKIPKDSPEEEGGLEYGFKTSFFAGINTVAANLDRIVVFFFLSPAAAAIFAAADRISDIFKNLTQDISGAIAPKLAREKGYTKRIDNLFLLYSFAMGLFITVFTFTLLPPVMLLLFSEKYAESIPYAQALMISMAIGNASIMRFRYIRSTLDFKSYKIVTLYQAGSRIISLITLVPLFGIWGAVGAAFIARITIGIVIHHLIKKHHLLN